MSQPAVSNLFKSQSYKLQTELTTITKLIPKPNCRLEIKTKNQKVPEGRLFVATQCCAMWVEITDDKNPATYTLYTAYYNGKRSFFQERSYTFEGITRDQKVLDVNQGFDLFVQHTNG